MAYILPQTDVKKAISKVINGRLMYENVAPNQVVAMEVAGWALSQVDMTRKPFSIPYNKRRYDFQKIFAPNVI